MPSIHSKLSDGAKAAIGDVLERCVQRSVALTGYDFDPDSVHPRIRGFYERTTGYELGARVEWRPLLGLFARARILLTAHRAGQFAPPAVSLGSDLDLTNEVVRLLDPNTGEARAAAWLRRSAATGRITLAGLYSVCELPGHAGRFLKGVYPMPYGSATVILRPENHSNGTLTLVSNGMRFGGPGYYRAHFPTSTGPPQVAFAPIKQIIRLFVDPASRLRIRHAFSFCGVGFLVVRYEISSRGES